MKQTKRKGEKKETNKQMSLERSQTQKAVCCMIPLMKYPEQANLWRQKVDR